MKPRVLILVSSDPRTSGRAVEAVRIAAGVGVWQRVDITLYLRGEAVRLLADSAGDLMDGADLGQYWPLIAESRRPVYVEQGAETLVQLGEAALPFEELDDARLAKLAATQHSVLRF